MNHGWLDCDWKQYNIPQVVPKFVFSARGTHALLDNGWM